MGTDAASRSPWNRDYFLLFQGQAVSALGSQAYFIAITYWVFDATGSTAQISLVAAVNGFTAILVFPFAGTLADRWLRKRVIVTCDVVRGVLLAGVAAGVFLFAR